MALPGGRLVLEKPLTGKLELNFLNMNQERAVIVTFGRVSKQWEVGGTLEPMN